MSDEDVDVSHAQALDSFETILSILPSRLLQLMSQEYLAMFAIGSVPFESLGAAVCSLCATLR